VILVAEFNCTTVEKQLARINSSSADQLRDIKISIDHNSSSGDEDITPIPTTAVSKKVSVNSALANRLKATAAELDVQDDPKPSLGKLVRAPPPVEIDDEEVALEVKDDDEDAKANSRRRRKDAPVQAQAAQPPAAPITPTKRRKQLVREDDD
jgi:hypothetical protein